MSLLLFILCDTLSADIIVTVEAVEPVDIRVDDLKA